MHPVLSLRPPRFRRSLYRQTQDSLLNAVEQDIADSKFADPETRLRDYLNHVCRQKKFAPSAVQVYYCKAASMKNCFKRSGFYTRVWFDTAITECWCAFTDLSESESLSAPYLIGRTYQKRLAVTGDKAERIYP